MKLATAQGEDMEIKGQVNLNLQIAGHKFDVTTQVVSHLSPEYDIILGIGFLNSHYSCLRTSPGHTPIFCIDNTDIPIVKDCSTQGWTILNVSNITPDVIDFAKSASETYIKPRSKGFLKLAIPNNEKLLNNNLVYFEEIDQDKGDTDIYGDSINDKEMFKIHKGVIKIRISGNGILYCYVPYTNLSSDIVKFNKGQRIGVLSVVEEVRPEPEKTVAATQERNNANGQPKIDKQGNANSVD